MDERAAHELYLRAYEAALTDGGASSVMCSYAKYQIAGVQASPAYACENAFGLRDVLRTGFGFTGWVTSDYGASHATSDLLGRMDQEFLSGNLASAALKPLVDPASAAFDPAYAAALGGAVARILYHYQRFGRLDDASYPGWAKTRVPPAPAPAPFDEHAGIVLARRLAEESAVLLKNEDDVLPLPRGGRSSVAVIGPTADVLAAAPGTERSRGVGQRTTISPLDVLRAQEGPTRITYAPGIDRVGTTVPAAALSTAPGGPPGLTRTTTAPDATVVGTTVDAALTGDQTDLVKGDTYTWTGVVDVPSADTWTFWLQRPAGTVVGSTSGPNGGVNPGYQAGPFTGVFDSATMSVDGTATPLKTISTLHPNNYKRGPTFNGQYLGLNVVGAALPLTPGEHRISITYATSPKAATVPTLRLTWAPQQQDVDAAVTAAAHARTAVVFVDDADTTTAAGDVGTLGPGQDGLIEKVAAANPNTVVVLNTGAGVTMPWLDRVRGVLEMWFPGQEGGTATADLLLGTTNPSGRLPITFPTGNSATPFAGHPERATGVGGQIVWSEGLQMGYRWYLANSVKPLFPFGFGLSYSSFVYGGLQVTGPHGRSRNVEVSFTVKNTGRVTGTEVPQLYLRLPSAADEPSQRLTGFDRVTLRPGQSTRVRRWSTRRAPTARCPSGTPARTTGGAPPASTRSWSARPSARPCSPAASPCTEPADAREAAVGHVRVGEDAGRRAVPRGVLAGQPLGSADPREAVYLPPTRPLVPILAAVVEDWTRGLESLLDGPSPAVLTTYRQDGTAVASPVWFRFQEGAFEVVIAEDDAKLRHLARQPQCSLVVFEAVPRFRGVRLEGEPSLHPGDVQAARREIASRYLGAERGHRFAEQRGTFGVLLRLPARKPHAWNLSVILPPT